MRNNNDHTESHKHSHIRKGVNQIISDIIKREKYRNTSSKWRVELMEIETAKIKWVTRLVIGGTAVMVILYFSGFFLDALAKTIRSCKNIRNAISNK